MTHPISNIADQKMSIARLLILVVACSVTVTAQAEPPRHYLHAGAMPPGAVGSRQLMRGGPLPGYYQPVEIRAPEGAQVAYAMEYGFSDSQLAPAKAGMMIGSVYRLKITGIPRHEGEELYPTIEVIDRLYPPLGQELKFPIPIEFAPEDIEAAFQGKFVTRIIYLENPRGAYPKAEDPKVQHYFEVGSHEDPLVVADRLGRPMAILRIGGRTPDDPANPGPAFLYNSPPLLRVRPRPLARIYDPTTASNQRVARPESANGAVAQNSQYAFRQASAQVVSTKPQEPEGSWAIAGDIR
jgi:hypothetical protein